MNTETVSFYAGLAGIGITIAVAYWSHLELKKVKRLILEVKKLTRELRRFARWTHLELQEITQILLQERRQDCGS